MRPYLDAALAIVQRDLALYLSYRARFVGQLLALISSLALFYFISKLISVRAFASPEAYFGFAVVGVAILQMLTATFTQLPTTLRQELVAGTFEGLVLSPLGAVAGIVAMALFPSLLALVLAVLTVIIAALAFGLELQWSTAGLAIPVALVAALAFVPFSLLLAALVLTIRQVLAGASFLVTILSLVGGFLFPVSLLPDWIRWTSEVQPFTPTVELLRHLLIGTQLDDAPALVMLRLIGFAALLFPVSVIAMRAALKLSQVRGTIIEY